MVEIRHAQARDVDAITEIYNALIPTTAYEWTETLHTMDERRAWLEAQQSEGRPVLVAVDGDDVVGWASYPVPRTARIPHGGRDARRR